MKRLLRARVLLPLLAILIAGAYFLYAQFQLPPPQIAARTGTAAPDFTLKDQDGAGVRLSSFRGQPVVLIFFRGHW